MHELNLHKYLKTMPVIEQEWTDFKFTYVVLVTELAWMNRIIGHNYVTLCPQSKYVS